MPIYYTSKETYLMYQAEILKGAYGRKESRQRNKVTKQQQMAAWKPRHFQGGMNYGSTTQYDSHELKQTAWCYNDSTGEDN